MPSALAQRAVAPVRRHHQPRPHLACRPRAAPAPPRSAASRARPAPAPAAARRQRGQPRHHLAPQQPVRQVVAEGLLAELARRRSPPSRGSPAPRPPASAIRMTRSGAACGASRSQSPARRSSSTEGSRNAVERRSEPSPRPRSPAAPDRRRSRRSPPPRRPPPRSARRCRRRRSGCRSRCAPCAGTRPGAAAPRPLTTSRVRKPARSSVWWCTCGARPRSARPAPCACPSACGTARLRGSSSNIAARPGARPSSANTAAKAAASRLRHVARVLEAVERVEGALEPAAPRVTRRACSREPLV